MRALFQKRWSLLLLIAAGLVLAIINVKTRQPLEHQNQNMLSRVVNVIEVTPLPFRARITAYGRVEPEIRLQSMAQVSGKISYLHPDLKQGASLPADTLVARIDPEDYQVALKQAEAELQSSQYALQQLQEEEKTSKSSLQIAKQNLERGEKELNRIQQLLDKKLVAQSQLDIEEQKTLQLRQQVTELQGKLNTYNSRKKSEKARIERLTQQIHNQQTLLARTEIRLPFDARIGEVSVDEGEFVGVGSPLFEALDINGVEINAQLSIQHMRNLVSHMAGIQPAADSAPLSNNMIRNLNLTASVELVGMDNATPWEARVIRISEAIDPTRKTLGIVVAIDKPYEKMIPGKRPPLLKGMYTAVHLTAPAQQAIVIPRKALHEGRVYLVNAQQQLEIRPVSVRFTQDNLVVISQGLQPGDKLITTDLFPVIEAMPVTAQIDNALQASLARQASGELSGE